MLSISTDVPAPVTWSEPALRAPSVPEKTSLLLVAAVIKANSDVPLSKPKKPTLADPS